LGLTALFTTLLVARLQLRWVSAARSLKQVSGRMSLPLAQWLSIPGIHMSSMRALRMAAASGAQTGDGPGRPRAWGSKGVWAVQELPLIYTTLTPSTPAPVAASSRARTVAPTGGLLDSRVQDPRLGHRSTKLEDSLRQLRSRLQEHKRRQDLACR